MHTSNGSAAGGYLSNGREDKTRAVINLIHYLYSFFTFRCACSCFCINPAFYKKTIYKELMVKNVYVMFMKRNKLWCIKCLRRAPRG